MARFSGIHKQEKYLLEPVLSCYQSIWYWGCSRVIIRSGFMSGGDTLPALLPLSIEMK